jgi:Putative Ig domain
MVLLGTLLASHMRGQIFVSNVGDGTVGAYNSDGTTINGSLVSGLSSPTDIAVSGSNVFVVNTAAGTVGKYTTSGAIVNASLISGLNNPVSIAVTGSNLFVGHGGTIGEYDATTGATINASLISGISGNANIAISGSNLFVANTYSTIGEYTTSGATVNAALISGLTDVGAIAVSGTNLYVVNEWSDINNHGLFPIGLYTTSGATVNASFLYTNSPTGIAVLGGRLFVGDLDDGTIGEYDATTGATINASLISGLNAPEGLAFGGPPIITSPLSVTATVGQLFVYQIAATGNPTSYTATPLPPGLTFDDGHGILSGNPTTPGTTQIQLTASNAAGAGQATLTLTVQSAPASGPVIMGGTSITARTGVPFSYEVFTTGGSPTARLSVSGLPPGLSADAETGRISGTSDFDGSFGLTLTVTDGANVTASTLQLTFISDPTIPVIVSSREADLPTGQFFTYTIVAPSSSSGTTTYSLIGTLPNGLGFDPFTGTISGTFSVHALNGGALLGNVQLVATNSSGTTTSPLSFFQAVPASAVNISTRLAVGTSDNVLIGGFIVTGNAPKKVIVRAVGPELTALGVPGAMQDTTLELHDGTGALIATNDDWKVTQMGGVITEDQADAIHISGAGPTDDRESAIIATLAPFDPAVGGPVGLYTAIVRGKDGSTGVASVELYDLGTASLDVSSKAQLANISTRGVVQTGDNVMIGGFIIQGDSPGKVIVRAIGPSLTAKGVAGALADPTLGLHDGEGALIGSNDDWKTTEIGGVIVADQVSEIQNSGLAPTDDHESAILATLPPGNYTAIVGGKNNTTGVALVEAYGLQ